MRLILIALILLVSAVAHGEYRAHRLLITNVETGTERYVVSTLDHMQYSGYYPLRANEVISYVTSWRCRGRTDGFKPICAQPEPTSEPKPNSTP